MRSELGIRRGLWAGLILSGVLTVGLTPGRPAAAHEGEKHEAGDTAVASEDPLAGMVGIGDNLYFSGAVITPGDGSAVRSLSAYQTAAFVQSWMPTALFGGPQSIAAPPKDVPVTRVDVSGQWGPGNLGVHTIYYATSPEGVFVSWPQEQAVVAAPGGPPPPQEDWFRALPRVTDALAGKAELIETAGTQQADDYLTATTEAEAAEAAETGPDGASDGSSNPANSISTFGVAVAVVAAGVLIAVVWRRRRS